MPDEGAKPPAPPAAAIHHNEDDDEVVENLVAKFQTLAAEGDVLAKKRAFLSAIDIYTRALEIRPTDKHCLVCRSQCFIQIGAADQALADADSALREYPDYFKAILQKAEALYAKGDFELALMHFHRGNRLRPELDEFRVGIQKAREAIENSIGGPRDSVQPFGDLGHGRENHVAQKNSKSRASTMRRMESANAGGSTAGANGGGVTGGNKGVSVSSTTANVGNTGGMSGGLSKMTPSMESKLLGELYEDKCYLQSLVGDRDFVDHPDPEVIKLVGEGLRYLSTRVEFWRQQHPLYARPKTKRIKPRMDTRVLHFIPRKDTGYATADPGKQKTGTPLGGMKPSTAPLAPIATAGSGGRRRTITGAVEAAY
ncbi:Tetratricopeptide repeat protein 25 [Irineochytrium annulatum]|nr:Tetratricopeptide repeat protein 25 [Irineochytrium annulatum]